MGILTSRDAWVYGFSKNNVIRKTKKLIDNYNRELDRLKNIQSDARKDSLNRSDNYVNWSFRLEERIKQGREIEFYNQRVILTMYRPFTKKWLYYEDSVIERTRLYYKKFGSNNIVILTTGRGVGRNFSALVSKLIPNQHTMDTGQGFMRYDNEEYNSLLEFSKDNMNQSFADKLGLSFDDTFSYVYGLLNSREYQEKYANDLKKDLARIPIVKNIEKYVEIGKELMDIHLNYEEVPLY